MVLQVRHSIVSRVCDGVRKPCAVRKGGIITERGSVNFERSGQLRILLLHGCGFRVCGLQSRDSTEASAEEGGVELRDLFAGFDQTENVEVGERHAFKADPAESMDAAFEDATEGFGVPTSGADDSVERDLDCESDEVAPLTAIVE